VSDWLAKITGGQRIRSIEVEQLTRVQMETDDQTDDDEQKARNLLGKAEGMITGPSFDRATTVAVVGAGWAVLALVRELRRQRD